MEVTIGGNRLGSGKKQKQELHNYNRATFNQEQDWKSSMAPGILYPFLCIPMTNGDSMDIDLDSFARTLPTKGPLFGSYKLQADIFSVPMRLYNGILHNNPTEIGLKMNQIYMPKLQLKADNRAYTAIEGATIKDYQIANNALLKYLGLSGIGLRQRRGASTDPDTYQIVRKINAIPVLAYYDIFKNYYANKQETTAYVIIPGNIEGKAEIKEIIAYNNKYRSGESIGIPSYSPIIEGATITIKGNGLNADEDNENTTIQVRFTDTEEQAFTTYLGDPDEFTLESVTPTEIKFRLTTHAMTTWTSMVISPNNNRSTYRSNIELYPFELKNIDLMREEILKKNALGEEFVIGQNGDWTTDSGADNGLPYTTLYNGETVNTTEHSNIFLGFNSFAMNGLVLKTYQSDIFNNWINTEWIEGENGINAISAVNVSEGSFEIDALNLAQKVYEYLNRIAIAGGTYEDWQEATYTSEVVRKAETPIYEGGMAAEIMFEEVIQTAETNVENDFQALGALGGKGTIVGQKGGHEIHIKAKEPVFIMGIVSITPRICYTQGNEWYLTELNSYDDLHKPVFDQIGFQDVITEQMAWWDTHMYVDADNHIEWRRKSAGKTVAWQNYMTAVDKAYGDFAENGGKNFMVLSRNYESTGNFISGAGTIKDLTTYIDPAKFNYAFAYTDLAAQNFWVQIHSKVITRRVMSAHQIPNL